jgi:hypothetical protein
MPTNRERSDEKRVYPLLKYAVLGGQILVPQQEFLIDRSCDVGEHACPNHLVASPPIAKDRSSPVAGEP